MPIASLAPFSGIAASLVMGDRKRRRWQHYLRTPEDGGLKTALSAASAATFQAIRGKGDHINDYTRLLVTEELLLTDGSTFTWEYFQPVQLVQQVLDKCSGIARLYAEKLRDNPPSPDKPWRVVLGCDEHTPGSNVVSVDRRKSMALVFNFVELGPDILECDASWYIPVIVRAQVFKKLPGGWSAMLRATMRQLLVGPDSSSCAGDFVPIEINPGLRVAYQLTAALQTALSDGEGIMK